MLLLTTLQPDSESDVKSSTGLFVYICAAVSMSAAAGVSMSAAGAATAKTTETRNKLLLFISFIFLGIIAFFRRRKFLNYDP